MKKTILILILLTQAFITLNVHAQDSYNVTFKNISMKEFINFVSTFTQTNIIYNEADLKGTVSIASQYPMSESAIMEVFNSTLQSNGLIPIKENDYIRVIPEKDMANYNDMFADTGITADNFVTTIIVLKNYNAVALANTLTRVKSKFGNVEPLKGLNAILIKDYGTRIEKMRDIVSYMDSYASDFQLYSISLENTTATKMEQLILKFFNELVKNAMIGQAPVIVGDDISNVLVVACTADDFKKVQYIVSQVDRKSTAEGTLPQVYYLKYAKAEDVESVLNKILNESSTAAVPAGARATNVKNSVTFDKSTNSIVAIGDAELYANVQRLIQKLDIPRKQVYVEALILETSLDRSDSYGVEWFAGGASGDTIGFGGSTNTGNMGSVLGGLLDGSGSISSLPGGFSGGIIGDVVVYKGITIPSLSAFMTALQSDSGVNIVSNPQILTLDNEEAEVFVGENRPYLTSEKFDSNNNPIQTYDYRNVGIRLKVTPHISGEDMVTLDIEQEVNKMSPSAANSTAPITLTRTTKTKVQLYDKTIMVISGLMKDDSSTSTSGIPVLSSIPVLGWLFKSTSTTSEKTNLTVFITTHIIHENEEMNELVRRRLRGTSEFNNKVNEMIKDNMSEKSADFIPMKQEIDLLIANEAEAEAE